MSNGFALYVDVQPMKVVLCCRWQWITFGLNIITKQEGPLGQVKLSSPANKFSFVPSKLIYYQQIYIYMHNGQISFHTISMWPSWEDGVQSETQRPSKHTITWLVQWRKRDRHVYAVFCDFGDVQMHVHWCICYNYHDYVGATVSRCYGHSLDMLCFMCNQPHNNWRS